MASCEKCWDDAFLRAREHPFKNQADCYRELLAEREDDPCTPEEQAGEDADICPICERQTIHQHARICTNPECKHKEN